MVENIHGPNGGSPEGERRKTAVIREGVPRKEVLSAMEETGSPTAAAESERIAEQAAERGTLLEGLAGTCAAVLAVLAILGTSPLNLAAIGVIVLGGAVLISAGGVAAIAGRLRSRFRQGQVLAEGADLEALAGAGVVAGGILVLCNVVPSILLPVAIIVLGSSYLLASGGLRFFMAGGAGEAVTSKESAAIAASALEILAGWAGIVLGVLALAGMSTLFLSEIAVLGLAVGVLAKCMIYSAGAVAGAARW
jgi:hypothetical protein